MKLHRLINCESHFIKFNNGSVNTATCIAPINI